MKLISCYIEKFGGLSGYSLDFSQGVTVIHAPNGFGKTTLAEFLRAMFYGFPRKGKTLDKSYRQKYTPWSGGKFGGNLVFEHEGKRYRLERTFGATPRSDSFSLMDLETGSKSQRFSENIGLELFGLDSDSFERSTYLPQSYEGGSLTTVGIQAKLGDLVEDTGDINNFDKAVAALKARRSGFIPYRGSGGTVAEAAGGMSRVQQELDRALWQKEELGRCEQEIEEAEAELLQSRTRMEENQQQLQEAVEAAAARRQYEDLLLQLRAVREKLEGLEERYPRGIPGGEELDTARAVADELAALENSGLSQREQAQFEKLRGAMEAGLLEEARLEALSEENRTLLRQRAALEGLELPEEDRHRMEELKGFFSVGIPGEEEIARQRRTVSQAEELARENAELEARLSGAPVKRNPAMLIAGGAAAVLGAVLLILKLFVPGAVLLAVGILLAAAGFVRFGRERKQAEQAREELRQQIRQNEEALESGRRAVREFLSRYGSGEEGLDAILRNREEALNLLKKQHILKEKRAVQEAQLRQAEESLRSRLGSGDFDRAISNLYLAREKALNWQAQEEDRAAEQAALEEKLDEILAPWGLPREQDLRGQLRQIRDDGRDWADALDRQGKLTRQLEQFPEMPEDSADPESLRLEGRQLSGRYAALTEHLLKLQQQRENLRQQADRIPELSDELERLRTRKADHQHKAAILDDTLEFLTRARETLTTGYLGPIRESFQRYLTLLNPGQEEQAFISPELQVQLERQGQARELAYFSAGQTDLVMLCMRFALVDALFREAKPFVILDDPFVNLDDERTAEALKLLQKLAEDRQIIYLTCSRSRL